MTDQENKIEELNTSYVEAETASWIAQLDSDSMTDADRLALREWASRSPRHTSELRKLGEMWFDIDALLTKDLEKFDAPVSASRVAISALRVRPQIAYAAVAALLLCVFTLTFALQPFSAQQQSLIQIAYSVPEGQNEKFDLEDGSTVHLNTDSLIEVEYGKTERIVRLIRGEAHFDVVHDVRWPFFVHAGGNVVEAVGTAFVVRFEDAHTSVIVTEGKVEFTPLKRLLGPDSSPTPETVIELKPAILEAGQSLNVGHLEANYVPKVEAISADELSSKLAWRDGIVVFNGESLEHVIHEISRYTPSNIVISDPAVRDLPIGGSFPVGEVDLLLSALEGSFGVSVNRVDDNLIYLTKASAQ